METDPDSGVSNKWTYKWRLIFMKFGQRVENANYVNLLEKQTKTIPCLPEI